MKPIRRNLHYCLIALASSSLSIGVIDAAVTINWGNAPANSTVNFDSGGNPLNDVDFTFEFGVFDSGTPTGESSIWRNQWVTVDTPEFGYNVSLQSFQSTWNAPDNSLSGRQASIWIHNGDFSATDSSEWVIYTSSDWIIPDMSDQRQTPLEFRITDLPAVGELFPADEAIFGGLFNVDGPGEFSDQPPGAIIQTFTFIPEPSSAILVLFFGSAILLRRRR